MPMTTTIHPEIVEAIESELAYQKRMTESNDRPDMIENLSAGDILLAMEYNLDLARSTWYFGSGQQMQASEFIRKVTALGVRFMETCSAPPRPGPTPTGQTEMAE